MAAACRGVTDETPSRADKRNPDPLQVLARRERWVVTTAEMREAGLSRHVVARHEEAGTLVRQFRGVYLVGRTKPTQDERERAAVKACGDGAVLSHRSAARRWKILRHHRGPVEVTARTQRRRRKGLHPYLANLAPADVTIKDGVPITTVARTLVDLAMLVDEAVLDTAVHEADNLKRLHLRKVDEAIARAGATRRGIPALRRRLTRHRPASGRLDTDMEKRFVQFLRRYGFPISEHGVTFDLEDGERTTVDVLFRDAWVASSSTAACTRADGISTPTVARAAAWRRCTGSSSSVSRRRISPSARTSWHATCMPPSPVAPQRSRLEAEARGRGAARAVRGAQVQVPALAPLRRGGQCLGLAQRAGGPLQ